MTKDQNTNIIKFISLVLPICSCLAACVYSFATIRSETTQNTTDIKALKIRVDNIEDMKQDIAQIKTDLKWLINQNTKR